MSEVLNCDAPGCGHVEHVGTITEDMIDMPCPACGANLLTQGDWIAWQPYAKILASLRELDSNPGDEKVLISVGLHGSKTTIQVQPAEEPEQGKS